MFVRVLFPSLFCVFPVSLILSRFFLSPFADDAKIKDMESRFAQTLQVRMVFYLFWLAFTVFCLPQSAVQTEKESHESAKKQLEKRLAEASAKLQQNHDV